MTYLKKISYIIICFFLFSCNSEPIEVGGLNPNQTQAMAWADWAAGLAAAETGPVSIAVAAGVSAAYYYDHLEQLPPIGGGGGRQAYYEHSTFTYLVDSDSIGVDHNLICQKYLAIDEVDFNFYNLKQKAKIVRPDLIEEIDMLTDEYFEGIYNEIKIINFHNEDNVINYIKRYVGINILDANKLKNHVIGLNSSNSSLNTLQITNNIFQDIESFELTNNEKIKLKNCFKIFKYSIQLWKI